MFQKMRLIKDIFVRTKALPGQEKKEREKERQRGGKREGERGSGRDREKEGGRE